MHTLGCSTPFLSFPSHPHPCLLHARELESEYLRKDRATGRCGSGTLPLSSLGLRANVGRPAMALHGIFLAFGPVPGRMCSQRKAFKGLAEVGKVRALEARSLASKQAIQKPRIFGHVSLTQCQGKVRQPLPGGTFCPFSTGMRFGLYSGWWWRQRCGGCQS